MSIASFKKLLSFLEKKGYILIGPQERDGQVIIDQFLAKNFSPQALEKMPLYSFKKFFILSQERIFEFSSTRISADFKADKRGYIGVNPESYQRKLVMVGLSIFDLKTLNLYRQVFEKDIYFQERFKNTLLIGYGPGVEEEGQFQLWQPQYEENVLEHIQFDIFLIKRGREFQVFTGTRQGQKLLDELGYKDYQHIQFTGIIKEEGVEPWVLEVKDKLKKMKPTDSLWQELGKKCIECGKCSIVCPTCFCFDIYDKTQTNTDQTRTNAESQRKSALNQPESAFIRERCWTTCFYSEFSEIAGGQKFLKTTAERIYFWYYHKFVRIPDEFSIPGCVGCARCVKVCPVGIDICQVLERIKGRSEVKECKLPS